MIFKKGQYYATFSKDFRLISMSILVPSGKSYVVVGLRNTTMLRVVHYITLSFIYGIVNAVSFLGFIYKEKIK